MENNNLNLRCMILHIYEGVQYKISGTLMSINESNDTCTIKFDNNRVEHNIPMQDIYINEGILNTIKKATSKVVKWLYTKVKGMVAFAGLDGKYSLNSFLNPLGMLESLNLGLMPSAVNLYPSKVLIDWAKDFGVNVYDPGFEKQFMKDSCNKEIDLINKFWHRVMQEAGTTDKTVAECVNYVNEKFYRKTALFESLMNDTKKALNEGRDSKNPAVVFSTNLIPNKYGGSNYGEALGSIDLEERIIESLNNQLSIVDRKELQMYLDAPEEDLDEEIMTILRDNINDPKKRHPICVWGAPGIGKTNILKNVIRKLKDTENLNLCIEEINCANMSKDDISLPIPEDYRVKDDDVETVIKRIKTAPLSWLPIYEVSTPEMNEYWESFYSTCRHKTKNGEALVDANDEKFLGGVIFFDELARLDMDMFNTMMALSDGNYRGMILANSWGIVAASNRTEDDPLQNVEGTTQPAFSTRWLHCMYTPEMSEWLDWAKKHNKKKGHKNIDPAIIEFVESCGESVWYGAITYGSFDRELRNYFRDNAEKIKNANQNNPDASQLDNFTSIEDYFNSVGNKDDAARQLYKTLVKDKDGIMYNTKVGWNGRTWEDISDKYYKMLQTIFVDNGVGWNLFGMLKKSRELYDYDGVHPSILILGLEKLPEESWKKNFKHYLSSKSRKLEDGTVLAYQYKPNLTPLLKLSLIKLMLLLIIIQETGDMNSHPVYKYIEYNKWRELFSDPAVIESIYNSAQLPKDYQEQDDKTATEEGQFPWKNNLLILTQAFEFILSQYTGDSSKEFANYVARVSKAKRMALELSSMIYEENNQTSKDIEDIITKAFPYSNKVAFSDAKLKLMLTVKCLNKIYKNELLVWDLKTYPTYLRKILFDFMVNCPFYRKMVNYISYMCKTLLTGTAGLPGTYGSDDDNILAKLVKKECRLDKSVLHIKKNGAPATIKSLECFDDVMAPVANLYRQNDLNGENDDIKAICTIVDIFSFMKSCLSYFSAEHYTKLTSKNLYNVLDS